MTETGDRFIKQTEKMVEMLLLFKERRRLVDLILVSARGPGASPECRARPVDKLSLVRKLFGNGYSIQTRLDLEPQSCAWARFRARTPEKYIQRAQRSGQR